MCVCVCVCVFVFACMYARAHTHNIYIIHAYAGDAPWSRSTFWFGCMPYAFCVCCTCCMYAPCLICMPCSLYVCLICMPHMQVLRMVRQHVLYACLMPYMYAVCLICMPYMCALYVCLICMPYMYASYSGDAHGPAARLGRVAQQTTHQVDAYI